MGQQDVNRDRVSQRTNRSPISSVIPPKKGSLPQTHNQHVARPSQNANANTTGPVPRPTASTVLRRSRCYGAVPGPGGSMGAGRLLVGRGAGLWFSLLRMSIVKTNDL